MVLTGETREMQENATPAKYRPMGIAAMRSPFLYLKTSRGHALLHEMNEMNDF